MRLSRLTALVTGGGDGIGRAIAICFAKEGAHVAIADLDPARAASVEAEIDSARGSALALHADVRSTADVDAAVKQAVARFGALDIVVNNAAVALSGDPATMPDEDWQRVIDTNLTSAFRVIRAALPHLRRRRGGSIINIASAQAHRSWANWTAYAAAKGGLISMTRQLAGQLGAENIRVNSISPGAINTPMNERRAASEGPELISKLAGQHALLRLGTPDEVAAVAVLLASPEGAFISGADIAVDGGLSALPRYHET